MDSGGSFGRYELIDLLGRGGMGEVWRAHDTETDRVIALKVLPLYLAQDEVFRRRFQREAHAAASLSEPHVVPIHNYGEIDGRLYVDMRLIEGRDLASVLAEGALEPHRAVLVVEQIGAALNAAHKAGLVHRDVKPSNILIGDMDFAYLIDFGIAQASQYTNLTASGSMIGTWAYMAPERFSTGRGDARSDTYSLACVLYECLTGHWPYPGESVEQQVLGHVMMPPPRPSAVGWVPSAFDDIIATGMAKAPEKRYETSYEFAKAARAAITSPTPRPPIPQSDIRTMVGLPLERREPTPPPEPIVYREPPRVAATPPPPRAAPPPPPTPPPGVPTATPSGAPTQKPNFAADASAPPSAPPPRHHTAPQSLPPTPTGPGARLRDARVLIPLAIVVALVLVLGIAFGVRGDDEPAAAAPSNPVSTAAAPAPPPTPERELPQPNFQGTFTATFGPPTDLNGGPIAGSGLTQTWAVEPVCIDTGCQATASLIEGNRAGTGMVFDLVDGRWVGVSANPGTNCHDDQDQRWVIFTLQSASDTSLTGEWRELYPIGACAVKRTVTFARTGDVSASVADPESIGPRVVSPAAALRGTYKYEELFDDHHHHREFRGETFCTHDGTNCLSYLTGPDGAYPMTFVDGKWSVVTSEADSCGQKLTKAEYPLPQPTPNPITTLTGHAERTLCNSTFDFDVRLSPT